MIHHSFSHSLAFPTDPLAGGLLKGVESFFLSGPPLLLKRSPTQILGSPIFDTHLELFKRTMTLFRQDVPNLEVLKIKDIPGMPRSVSDVLRCVFHAVSDVPLI